MVAVPVAVGSSLLLPHSAQDPHPSSASTVARTHIRAETVQSPASRTSPNARAGRAASLAIWSRAAVARAGGAIVVEAPRRGYGSACLAGLAALGPTDVVVFLDGDYSDHPEELPLVIAPRLEGRADPVPYSPHPPHGARQARGHRS